jgi:hypothetical protein
MWGNNMMQIRAGWGDLTIAQLLWVQAMADSNGVIVRTHLEKDDPCVAFASGQRLTNWLRHFLRRLRSRALHLAQHTCDVCGATTAANSKFPVRCPDHTESEEKTTEIDLEEYSNCQFPHHALAEMAVSNPELALLGDAIIASDILTFSPELFAAAIALYQSMQGNDPWIKHVEGAVHSATYNACFECEYALIGRNKVIEVVTSIDLTKRLIDDTSLTAAVRAWARHGFNDVQLQSLAGNAIAQLHSFQAFHAVDQMLVEQRR